MEHAHVQEIKVPACSGNNQNYYSQIARYLDRLEKCFHFDIATYLASQPSNQQDNNELSDQDKDHHPELELQDHSLTDQMVLTRSVVNYFKVADALSCGCVPNAQKPFHTISTTTTAFHFASKPSLRLSVDEASVTFNIPDLCSALWEYLSCLPNASSHLMSGVRTQEQNCTLPFERIQIWHKVCVQQMYYYKSQTPDAPQTLCALPPSTTKCHGMYDMVIVNAEPESNWP